MLFANDPAVTAEPAIRSGARRRSACASRQAAARSIPQLREVTVADSTVRRSFVALHLTLALVVIVESARSLIHAFGALAEHHHLALLASAEIVAALLFLWPRTLRIGGSALMAIFLVGVLVHAMRGELAAELLVYAAATLFVTVHGSAWRHPAPAE